MDGDAETDGAFFRRRVKVATRPESIVTNPKPCAVNNTDIGPGTSTPPNGGVVEVTTDTSFAEFAIKLNAGSLTELLDIAVVYLSIIKGQACFSGPDVMQLLRKQLTARFDKETSWKGFYALRRDGKIEKLGPAQFRITAKIGYRVEEELGS